MAHFGNWPWLVRIGTRDDGTDHSPRQVITTAGLLRLIGEERLVLGTGECEGKAVLSGVPFGACK